MKGRWVVYSAAELVWLEENRLLPISDYHAAFVAAFGRPDVTAMQLHALRKRKGWKTGRTGQFSKGMAPMNKGQTCPEGTGGRHPNARKTQFRKGGLPHNTRFIGAERIDSDGYVWLSVAERNPHTGADRRFVLKHRWLWEQQNGPLPKGHALKCLDGDRSNTAPENWLAIPRSMLPRLNGRWTGLGYDEAPEELKPVLLTAARLNHAARQARKGGQ